MEKVLWLRAGGNSLAKAVIKGNYLYVQFGHKTSAGWRPWTLKRRYKIIKGSPWDVAGKISEGHKKYAVRRNYAVIGRKTVLLHDREHKYHYEMWAIVGRGK